MNIYAQDIIAVTRAHLLTAERNDIFDGVMIDSRQTSKNGLFVALKGHKTDGHFYLEDAYQHGARGAIVDNLIPHPPEMSLYLVDNTEKALKGLGEFCSRQLTGTKIAITGTVGKTTAKIFFQHLLEILYKVAATPQSYNTLIGVSSSFCNFSIENDFYVIEAGINKKGEMSELAKIIDPNIVVFTAFGRGHLEGFGNVETVVGEKMLLAQNAHTVYLHGDNPYSSQLSEDLKKTGKEVIRFGTPEGFDNTLILYDYHIDLNAGISSFIYRCEKQTISFRAPFFSPELMVILLPALHLALKSGISTTDIQGVLESLLLPEGREKIDHIGNGYVIDDSYNANPVSMKKALHLLERFSHQGYQTWAVLGDMLEMGNASQAVHEECIRSLEEHHINNVILFGPLMHEAAEKVLSKNSLDGEYYLASSPEEIQKILLDQVPKIGDKWIVLFKGSRGMKMEEAIPPEWRECGQRVNR